MHLHRMSRPERMRLMKFACSFAWTDLDVSDEEKAWVRRLMRRLHLDEEERGRVEGWLEVPPRAEQVDPQDVPKAHRKLLLEALHELAEQDGRVDPEEQMSLDLLEQLLR